MNRLEFNALTLRLGQPLKKSLWRAIHQDKTYAQAGEPYSVHKQTIYYQLKQLYKRKHGVDYVKGRLAHAEDDALD